MNQCQVHGVRIPKKRAINLLCDTPQYLEIASIHAREGENRMRIRLNCKDLKEKGREYAEDGDYESARLYYRVARGPNYIQIVSCPMMNKSNMFEGIFLCIFHVVSFYWCSNLYFHVVSFLMYV